MEGKWRMQMVYLFGILIAVGAFYFTWILSYNPSYDLVRDFVFLDCMAALSAGLGVLGGWIIHYITIKKVPACSVLMDLDGNPMWSFPSDAYFWRWDKRLKGAKIVSYARQEITATTKDIYTHAGVIINFSVVLETVETPLALMERKRAIAGLAKHALAAREDDWLNYHIYRFIAEFGEALKALNNPYDQEQQRRFDLLIHRYMDSVVKGTGMVMKETWFS